MERLGAMRDESAHKPSPSLPWPHFMAASDESALSTMFLFISPDSTCLSSEIRCQDGACVPYAAWCNQMIDCPDASDEKNCSKTSPPLSSLSLGHFLWGPHVSLTSTSWLPR